MKQFEVIESFNDKYTDEQYVPGVLFLCDDSERIANLQERGLIGEEIPQSPLIEKEDEGAEELEFSNETTGEVEKEEVPEQVEEEPPVEVAAEEASVEKDVKPDAKQSKRVAKSNA